MAAPTAFSIDLTQCPETLSPPQFVSMVMKMLHGNGNLAIGTPLDNSNDAAAGISPSDNSGDYTGAGAVSAAKGVAIRLYNRADNTQVKLYENSASTWIF